MELESLQEHVIDSFPEPVGYSPQPYAAFH